MVTDDRDMAGTALCSRREETTDMPESERLYMGDETLSDISFPKENVCKKLKNLNTTAVPNPDGVLARILQKIADPLSLPLSIIFQWQLDEVKVPYIWRMANVCQIFKKGTKKDQANYCQVSLTCIVGKVFESFMSDRMVKHLLENSLIGHPITDSWRAGRPLT